MLLLRVSLTTFLTVCFYYGSYLDLGGTFSTVLVLGKFFYVTFDLVLFADLVDLRLTLDLIDS